MIYKNEAEVTAKYEESHKIADDNKAGLEAGDPKAIKAIGDLIKDRIQDIHDMMEAHPDMTEAEKQDGLKMIEEGHTMIRKLVRPV